MTTTASAAKPVHSLTALNLKRAFRDFTNVFFTVVMPVGFYLLFGALQDYSSMPDFAHGNPKAFVMVSMALYGAVIAATAAAGGTVVESRSGWGRQLALTPTTPGHYLTAQVLSLALRCTLPVVAVFIAGALTGATMTASGWVACFFLCIAVSLPFGVYGMAFGELFRSDSAITIASTLIVVFAFAANMFMPLGASMLDFGRFTPLYGANALANYPLTDGVQIISDEPYYHKEALPNALANIAAWTAIFVITFTLLNRRQKGR